MIQCALCNFTNEVSIVQHIREDHNLQTYLNLFPDLPVVNKPLYAALENLTYFGYEDDTPGLEKHHSRGTGNDPGGCEKQRSSQK